MIWAGVCVLVVGGCMWTYRHSKVKQYKSRTVVDAITEDDVIKLVRMAFENRSTESGSDRLYYWMRRFPPSEAQMRELSIMQQHSLKEEVKFCATTLFAICVNKDVVDSQMKTNKLKRTASDSVLYSLKQKTKCCNSHSMSSGVLHF